MEALKIYTANDILFHVNSRNGEIKLGEQVQIISGIDHLKTSSARFVLLGIPEDIGVRANYGITGTSGLWLPALSAILNIQSNHFLNGSELLVLGHFDFSDPKGNTIPELQKAVENIDSKVYPVIEKIIAAGKIPIVIGGGHNNAYPIIKGISKARQKPVHAVNIDAHADLRTPEGRNSGNGFSYAIKNGFLDKYGIFGLHENYNNAAILAIIENNPHIYPVFFDDIIKSQETTFHFWDRFIRNFDHPGLEIDLDSIENILTSAYSPSGFSLNEIRKLILTSGNHFSYLHVCEGAVDLADGRRDPATAKTVAYLVTDFVKNQLSKL